jgi:sulfide:quinone oxidoreductase
MDPFSVVVAGGGVAAVEGLLRIRRLLGDTAKITLLAPNDDFAVRALSVNEPFARSGSARHSLREIARDADAHWVKDTLAWVDVAGKVAHTGKGKQLPHDALLIAVGARMAPAFDYVTTFDDAEADALFGGIVQDIEAGYTKSVAFVMPPGPVWQLPLYELALMTAERAGSMGMDDVELTVVTPDEAPLAIFGPPVSEAVAGLLERAGVAVETSTVARVPAKGRVILDGRRAALRPNRIVALPRFTGPAVRGVPGGGADGFIPFDAHCAVPGAGGHVFAAGDATRFPVKHGGLGAEQADTAAAAIAYLADVDVPDERFRPVIRGKLLTGNGPLYMKARLVGSGSFESEVSDEPLWPAGEKVAAEELSEYLGHQRSSS